MKEILAKYVKLVSQAIEINDENELEIFVNKNHLYLGLCRFLRFNSFYFIHKTIKRGFKIRNLFKNKYKNFNFNGEDWWICETFNNFYLLETNKQILLARKDIVEMILKVYYPNSILDWIKVLPIKLKLLFYELYSLFIFMFT